MSIDSQWDVQTAIFSALTSHTPLTALAQIFDDVPENTGFPYVAIGEMDGRVHTTQTQSGFDITLSIHSFSRYRGFKELRLIMAEIFSALHNANPAISGQTAVLCQFLSSSTTLEDAGKTRHGIQKFQIITEPT